MVCVYGHVVLLAWTDNRQIRSGRTCFDPSSAPGTSHGHRQQQTFACTALLHRPRLQPAPEKARPCGFWTGRPGRQGQGNTGFFYPAQPPPHPPCLSELSAQNFRERKEEIRPRVRCGACSCENVVQSGGNGGRESGPALLLVLANNHINSKVDNQVGEKRLGGDGEEGAASGVKRAFQRELVMARAKFEPGRWGRGRSGAKPCREVWNFKHSLCTDLT